MARAWIIERKRKDRKRSYCVRWINKLSSRCHCKTFHDLVEARQFCSMVSKEIRDGIFTSRLPFDKFIEQHIKNREKAIRDRIRASSIQSHKEALEKLVEFCNPQRLDNVDAKMIDRFIDAGLKAGYAKSTINKWTRTVRAVLSYAVRDGLLSSNPLIGRKIKIDTDPQHNRILTATEIARLFAALTSIKQKAVVCLAFYAGMRKGEVFWLKWMDIDYHNDRIHIINRDTHQTKTGVSRVVPMRPETKVLLSEMQQDAVNDYIFVNPQAEYWSQRKWFDAAVKAARIDRCTLHDLRRSCNHLILEAGIDQLAAMQVLGHKSSQVNREYYTGPLSEPARKAVGILPDITV